MLQVGVAHGGVVDQRNHQIPEADIGPYRMPARPDDAQQDKAERKTDNSGGYGRHGVLYGLNEPGTASAVTDMAESFAVSFEHADFVDLGAGDHRKAEMRHLVHECSRKGGEVDKKISEIVIEGFQDFDLQAF